MKKLVYLVAPLICLSTLVSCGDKYYKVSFVKDDGVTVLEEIQKVKVGTNPTYSGEEPTSTKTPRESHYFEFDGFKDDSGIKLDESYLMPSHDVVFTAQYLELGDLHTVKWLNYDESPLSIDTQVNYESHPIYNGDTPTKPDAEYDKFQFIGWVDDEGTEYSEDYIMPDHDVTFTAQFGVVAKDGFIYELSSDGEYYINCGLVDKSFSGILFISELYRALPVKEIKANAFEGGLFTSVATFESLETIGDCAFSGCNNLNEVTIGEKVNTIGKKAFYNCSSLKEFNVDSSNEKFEGGNELIEKQNKKLLYAGIGCSRVPEGVEIIGSDAFSSYKEKSVQIANSVEIIEDRAFYGCDKLIAVDFNLSYSMLSKIGKSAFEGCVDLEVIDLPESLITIDDYAFKGCVATERLTLRQYVTSIGNYAFSGCDSLEYVVMPYNLTSIGDYAFSECGNLIYLDLSAVNQIPTAGTYILGNKVSESLNICVKYDLVDEYKTTPGWITYADYIR